MIGRSGVAADSGSALREDVATSRGERRTIADEDDAEAVTDADDVDVEADPDADAEDDNTDANADADVDADVDADLRTAARSTSTTNVYICCDPGGCWNT